MQYIGASQIRHIPEEIFQWLCTFQLDTKTQQLVGYKFSGGKNSFSLLIISRSGCRLNLQPCNASMSAE